MTRSTFPPLDRHDPSALWRITPTSRGSGCTLRGGLERRCSVWTAHRMSGRKARRKAESSVRCWPTSSCTVLSTSGYSGRRGSHWPATKAFDNRPTIRELRLTQVTPHLAQFPTTVRRRSAIDRRTTRHRGYAVSQRKRKLIEQAFGWMKTIGGLRKLHHRGGRLVSWIFTFTAAAYNIVRLRRLLPAAA